MNSNGKAKPCWKAAKPSTWPPPTGLPLEVSRDIARGRGLDVDEAGFRAAREEHSLASGAGKAMGPLGGEDAEFFADILKGTLAQAAGKLGP